jgi:hypothetical protein
MMERRFTNESSDDESLTGFDEDIDEKRFEVRSRDLPVLTVDDKSTLSNRQLQKRLSEDRSSDTRATWEMEVESYPKREKTVRFCCYLSRTHAIFGLVVFIIMLTIVAGPLIGGFLWYASQESNASSPPSRTWLPPTSNITVGAYYYPWHSDDFHRGQGYLREQLATVQKPSLGEYDDSDPATIAQHLAWSRQANIRLWVTSWWGEGSREDITTKEVILNHPDLKNHKIALFYETTGRIKQSEEFSTHRVVPDIEYLCEKYFDHPNYFRIDGRPVLFIYLTRKLAAIGNLDTVIDLMKQTARNKGHDVFVVGDQVFGRAPNIFADEVYTPFETLDAATNYDVYGSMGALGGYAGEDAVKENYQKMLKWREIAHRHQCAFIPAASPGYNDLGVRPEKKHSPLSRQLTADDKPGSLFKAALREARNLVDAKVDNLLMVNSFNEWHEDTQIEPASGGSTTKPDDLTYGLEYHGYGELYLNILREQTKD